MLEINFGLIMGIFSVLEKENIEVSDHTMTNLCEFIVETMVSNLIK